MRHPDLLVLAGVASCWALAAKMLNVREHVVQVLD